MATRKPRDQVAADVERMIVILAEAGLELSRMTEVGPRQATLALVGAAGTLAIRHGFTGEFIKATENLLERLRARAEAETQEPKGNA